MLPTVFHLLHATHILHICESERNYWSLGAVGNNEKCQIQGFLRLISLKTLDLDERKEVRSTRRLRKCSARQHLPQHLSLESPVIGDYLQTTFPHYYLNKTDGGRRNTDCITRRRTCTAHTYTSGTQQLYQQKERPMRLLWI